LREEGNGGIQEGRRKGLVFTELDFKPWVGLCYIAFDSISKITFKEKNVTRLIALLQTKR